MTVTGNWQSVIGEDDKGHLIYQIKKAGKYLPAFNVLFYSYFIVIFAVP